MTYSTGNTDAVNTLGNIKLFDGISENALQAISRHTQLIEYPKHQVILREGDKTSVLQCILEGQVKVSLFDHDGKEFILKTLSAGDHFGELGLLNEAPRTASIITETQCKTLCLSREHFLPLLEKCPELNQKLIANLSNMVRELTNQVRSLGLKDVYGRLRTLFMENCSLNQPSEEKLTQQGIASRIGSSREMVARIMKDLVVGGYIQTEKKHIILLKPLPEHY